MPPKTKFSREDIVAAAFEIAKESGISGITARSVAERLGSSVAPIYVNFTAIEDLIAAVVEQVFALSDELVTRQAGADLFENIGKASLVFARSYPVLFRELVLQPNPYMAAYEDVEHAMLDAIGNVEALKDWTVEQRKRLFLKMRIFQLGLSAMVANGHVPAWLNEQAEEKLLLESGEDFYLAEQARRGEQKRL